MLHGWLPRLVSVSNGFCLVNSIYDGCFVCWNEEWSIHAARKRTFLFSILHILSNLRFSFSWYLNKVKSITISLYASDSYGKYTPVYTIRRMPICRRSVSNILGRLVLGRPRCPSGLYHLRPHFEKTPIKAAHTLIKINKMRQFHRSKCTCTWNSFFLLIFTGNLCKRCYFRFHETCLFSCHVEEGFCVTINIWLMSRVRLEGTLTKFITCIWTWER